MAFETTTALVVAAMLVAVVGGLFLGGFGLMLSIVILGIAVLAASGDVQAMLSPRPPIVPHPTRFACPSCGGDAYMGEAVCSACGAKLATSSA